jgi:putative membrane protein
MRALTFIRVFAVLAVSGVALTVNAHGAKPDSLSELWESWAFEPGIIVPLALSLWLYLRGLRQLWRTMGAGQGVRWWEAGSYLAGWLALFIALVSPVHPLGRVLFSAHMTQHELLMLVAAPLLVLGRPLLVLLKALPRGWARRMAQAANVRWWQRIWRAITYPLAAWVIHAVALWSWHVPALFQATIDNEWVHAFQHLSFLLSALLFWWAVMHGRQRVMGYGIAVLYMFTTAMHSGLLGALVTFSQGIIYPVYEPTTAAWGLSPLEDQQLGGLIMWVPAGLVYIIAGLALFAGWMRESDQRVRGWEQQIKAGLLANHSSIPKIES